VSELEESVFTLHDRMLPTVAADAPFDKLVDALESVAVL
jgi:hypothetical protein